MKSTPSVVWTRSRRSLKGSVPRVAGPLNQSNRSSGRPTETGWGRVFSRGSVRGAPTSYPSRAAIEASWNATHGRMREAFDAVTDGQLAAPPTIELPGAKTLADQAAFFAFHESYHVGQIGYVRKFLGHSAIAG